MPNLRLITSHSQRRLLYALGDNISSSPLSPLENECVITLSNGMSRWIAIELTSRLGVSAGFKFIFPNDLLDQCFKSILPDSLKSSPFAQNSLTWRIASHLTTLAKSEGFEQITSYLGDGHDDRHLLQISSSIAYCFDQYIIFRPEMICDWDNGGANHWQARLWRAISHECNGSHRAALLKEVQRHVACGAPPYCQLPKRISLFGISYLPSFHLEALHLLSSYTDVTCYLLNPCGEYWGTVISQKNKSRLAIKAIVPAEAEEYYETGNPLLSSLGTLGQEFFESLLEYGFDEESLDTFAESTHVNSDDSPPSLLSLIQSDILSLFDRTSSPTKGSILEADRSVQIHSCHGAYREMEILHDNLLAYFDELHELEPRQIVVMIPDIETYAPYISSVFGNRSTGRQMLPYTIADRSIRCESQFIDAFLRILGSSYNRFALHEMLDLLKIPLIRDRYNINEPELDFIGDWLTDCNVRWGLNADSRADFGFPRYSDFTWQAGMDRLFLGYAMDPENSSTFRGILPYPACSGRQADTLGKLTEFINTLRVNCGRFNRSHTLTEWTDIFTETINELLLPDKKDSAGPLSVTKAFNSLRDACSLHGFVKPISLEAIRDHLTEILTRDGGGYGFMGGAITFCAMLPMRSIPMRVVWLAGMSDGQFPRTERPPGFSLMNGARRRGDRSLRDEDRYLFLEALMAAEDCFCISYSGQNDRENSVIPPSVLVTELIDYISKGFTCSDSVSPVPFHISHRLQGFSPLYFNCYDPVHLFSYDTENFKAAESRRISVRSLRQFIVEPLPLAHTSIPQINLRQLRRFLANPAAAFLEQRLQVAPFNPANAPPESEPFSLDPLSRHNLLQELVNQLLKGSKYKECLTASISRGALPPLSAGKAAFDSAWQHSQHFVAKLEPHLGSLMEPLKVNFTCDRILLHGILEDCRSGMNTAWRCARMKGKDRLSIWLDHLILNAIRAEGYPLQSLLIANDSTLELQPLEDATAILTDLLNLYFEGMRCPLRFFPETSWTYINEGQQKAETCWRGNKRLGFRGELDNPAVSFCFGNKEPWGEEFATLADRIYKPLLDATKKAYL